jgi:DNA-binding transcriptional LysR family regulator
MADPTPNLSLDQVAAFVELARHGSLREAAAELYLSEQGVRSRLLALEDRLGVPLYHKQRGMRRGAVLTRDGQQFLPHALRFLEHGRELGELFGARRSVQQVHVVASQYLTYYVLIDAVKQFHREFPGIRIRMSSRTEREIETAVGSDPDVDLGIAAPYDPSPDLAYHHLFSMGWHFIAPRRHRLLDHHRLSLKDLAAEPLILFERGSTGRRHVLEAFHLLDIAPRIEMEMTNTQIIVRMVEAGLGVSIVPLLPSGVVTRGARVGTQSLGTQVDPIRSGILTRLGTSLPPAAEQFVAFVRRSSPWGAAP